MRGITYLCGGINGLSDADCKDWRAVAAARLGAVLDPMRRDYRGIEDSKVHAIVSGDLEDIANADYVLVNACRPSWGTAMEIVYAHRDAKPIVAFTDSRVSPWLRYHCDAICNSVEEACAVIEGWEAK